MSAMLALGFSRFVLTGRLPMLSHGSPRPTRVDLPGLVWLKLMKGCSPAPLQTESKIMRSERVTILRRQLMKALLLGFILFTAFSASILAQAAGNDVEVRK